MSSCAAWPTSDALRVAQDAAHRPAVLELEQRALLVGPDRQARLGVEAQQRDDRDLGVAREPLARDVRRRAAAFVGEPRDDLREAAVTAERVILHEHLERADVRVGARPPAVLAQLHRQAAQRRAVDVHREVGGILQQRHLRRGRGDRGAGLAVEPARDVDRPLQLLRRGDAHVVRLLDVEREPELPRPAGVVDGAQRGRRRDLAAERAEVDDAAVVEQRRERLLRAQMLELPGMDRQQHARPEVRQRRVERGAVDGRVLAQELLGELGRGRAGRAVVLDERGIDGQPVQREARLRLGRVGGDLRRVELPAALGGRVRHVAEQPGLLAVDEAQRSGAPEAIDVLPARVEERAHGGDALPDPRQQERRIGPARAWRGDVVVVNGDRRAELVGEHAHERVDRDDPRLAARHRDVHGGAKAVAVRGREMAHAGEDGRALVREGEHRDELVALLRELGDARSGDRAPLATFTRVAVQQRLGGRADGGQVAARLRRRLAGARGDRAGVVGDVHVHPHTWDAVR